MNQETRENTEPESNAFGPWVLVAQKRKPSRNASKKIRPEANSGHPSQSPTKPIRSLSPPSRIFLAEFDQNVGIRCNSDVFGVSANYVDCTVAESEWSKSKSMPFTSKVKKSVSSQKWKKSQDQLGQKATRQKGTPEWKMVKPKESEITSHKGNRERFGFFEMSMEIKEFRAGGSFDPKFIRPSLISNQPDYVLEKSIAVDDVVMSMGSPSDLETNGNTKQNSSL